ncbi:MAG TPA: L-arabinose ABC transporter permease AraH [Stellaceae bacterium]|nr:L-arabinose ABC transporter permease AraH [Stellaceae bacterium]
MSSQADIATTPEVSRKTGGATLRGWLENSGIVIIFVVLFLAFSAIVPNFMTERNIIGLLLSVTLIGTVSVTMMMVLALGEVDLSVASIVAFAGVAAALITNATESSTIGVIGGVLAGGVIGLVNGVIVSKLRINSLIATLATMEIVRGLAYITSHGDALPIGQDDFFLLGSASVFGLSAPVWVTIISFVVFGVLLNLTAFGKNVLAIGGNTEAARLAGVPVDRLKIIVFTLQGLLTGLAGVLLTSRMGLGDPKTSVGLELAVISACVLGGVSLTGGVATISGVLVGVLIMGSVQNAMSLLNVPTFYQYLIRGGILLLAVAFDRWKQTRR